MPRSVSRDASFERVFVKCVAVDFFSFEMLRIRHANFFVKFSAFQMPQSILFLSFQTSCHFQMIQICQEVSASFGRVTFLHFQPQMPKSWTFWQMRIVWRLQKTHLGWRPAGRRSAQSDYDE